MKLARINIMEANHGIEIVPMCPKCNIRLDVEDIKQKQRSRRLLSIIRKVLYVKTMISKACPCVGSKNKYKHLFFLTFLVTVKARCPKCHKVYTGFVKTS